VARWYAETFSDKNVVARILKALLNSYSVVHKNVSVHFGGTQKKICFLVVRIEEKVGNPCFKSYPKKK
jgi:hypothetical protein